MPRPFEGYTDRHAERFDPHAAQQDRARHRFIKGLGTCTECGAACHKGEPLCLRCWGIAERGGLPADE
jgi:hypothetical protein